MSRSDPITSADNAKLKLVRRLQRRRDARLFVAEGEDLVAAGGRPEFVLVAAGSGLDGIEVEPELLAKASARGSGTRAIGVFERPAPVAPAGPLCVALWGVGDPGNVGTILRSALAFGAASVALGPGCADPFGPKAVQASMGAVFDVPIARVEEVAALPRPTIALAARAGDPLRGPLAEATLLVGAEREGLPDEVVEACDRVAHIPIESESLNAAMAATVALYEAVRYN
ncbi:MAG TPA: RNA methyltransferase [Solirubrobacteraceae bacterium]|nr:RNA methyltransferase [Solirubrobacteraceae bacterium]